MPIFYEADGEIALRGDTDPTQTQTIPAGTAKADQEKAIAAFFKADAAATPLVQPEATVTAPKVSVGL